MRQSGYVKQCLFIPVTGTAAMEMHADARRWMVTYSRSAYPEIPAQILKVLCSHLFWMVWLILESKTLQVRKYE